MYGGRAGTESTCAERDWATNVTILSGDIDQNDINTDGNNIAETWADIQGTTQKRIFRADGTTGTPITVIP
ncbi:MAG: hypothetical protein R2856_26685 [Caldilineaceae bacterium]